MNRDKTEQNIPSGWMVKTLTDLGEFKTGGVDKKIKQNERPVKLVNYMDVYRRKFIDDSINFMEVTASDNEISTAQIKIGDMLFTPSSETPYDIGHSAVVAKELPNTLFSYHLARLRFNEEYNNKIDLNFRAYFCNSREVLKQFEKMSVGATRYTISKGKFESIQVLIPESKSEQQKIAEILGTVDEDIAKTQEVIEATEKLKWGLMQQLFTREINQKNWKEINLTDCFNLPSKLSGIKQTEYKDIGEFPIFDQGQNYISGYSDKKDLVVNNVPAILFGDHTRIIKYIKTPFVLGADGTKVFWAKENINSDFLYYLVLNQNIPNTGYNRHFKFLKDKIVSIPLEIKEQKEIAEILSAVDEKISINKKLKAKLTLLKKGLMQDLLSGKVRI